jgi:hypothetical protein
MVKRTGERESMKTKALKQKKGWQFQQREARGTVGTMGTEKGCG